mmetsp:Transcript_2077/g.4667  ORF Transcript_2077/g.4667 Transcript_2077/m.4667 type:complete len:218 (+) Transcript_2077:131-784(+)
MQEREDFPHGSVGGREIHLPSRVKGEYHVMVVEARGAERVFARPGAGGMKRMFGFGFTCGPSEYTQYSFNVQADGVRWAVSLRYSDFVEFDRTLRANFSHEELSGLGSLPDKTFLLNSGSPTLIETRKVKLQTYLNRLSNSPAVMRSGLVRDFLKFPEEDSLPVEAGLMGSKRLGYTPGAFATCRECLARLQTHKDDLDRGLCSVCARHRLWGSASD